MEAGGRHLNGLGFSAGVQRPRDRLDERHDLRKRARDTHGVAQREAQGAGSCTWPVAAARERAGVKGARACAIGTHPRAQHPTRTRAAHARMHGTRGVAHREAEPAPGCAGIARAPHLGGCVLRGESRPNAPPMRHARERRGSMCLRASMCAGSCARACAKSCATRCAGRQGRDEWCGDAPRVRCWRRAHRAPAARATGPR